MSNLRIIKKYIGNDEVDGTKIRLNNAEQLKANNMAGSATGLLKLTASDLLEFPQSLRPQLSSYVAPVSDAELAPKKFVDDSVATEVSARQLAMANEISARTAADNTEVSARELAMANEISARTAADNTEVSARELAMANEISTRAAADLELGGRLDVIEGSGDGSIAKAVADLAGTAPGLLETLGQLSDALVDGDIETGLLNVLEYEVSARQLAMANEISARTAADSEEVSARELAMANEISARSAADNTEVSARELAMANEISARTAADNTEVSARELAMANEISARLAASSEEVSARELAMANEISARTAADNTEVSARELAMANEISARAAADLALDGRLDIIEGSGGALTVGFTPAEVTDWDEGVDTVKEALDQVGADLTINAGEIGTLQSDLADEISARTAADNTEVSARELAMANEISARTAADNTEVSARELAMANEISARSAAITEEASVRAAADIAFDVRLDALETGDYSFVKEAFTLDNAGLTSVALDHLISDNSLVAFVGRLGLHVGVDYTLGVADGVSVITWIGSVAVGGDEALVVGDKIYVTYAHI